METLQTGMDQLWMKTCKLSGVPHSRIPGAIEFRPHPNTTVTVIPCLRPEETDGQVQVLRSTLPHNAPFPLHTHNPSVEILVCYFGELRVQIEGEEGERRAGAGEVIRVPENKEHEILPSAGETRVIAVLVPADPDFPNP